MVFGVNGRIGGFARDGIDRTQTAIKNKKVKGSQAAYTSTSMSQLPYQESQSRYQASFERGAMLITGIPSVNSKKAAVGDA
jgi:hypothetical protein